MKRWPKHKAQFWEQAPFFRLLLPLVTGIICYPLLPLPLHVPAIASAVFLLLYILAFRLRNAWLPFFASQAALFTIAWLLCYTNDVRHDKNWFGRKANTADFFVARVKDAPLEKENSYKLRVSLINTMVPGRLSSATGDAFVYLFKNGQPPGITKGDTILLPNKWTPIRNAGNPFEFDYADYCAHNNLYYQMSLPAKDIVLYQKGRAGDAPFTERCHDWCMRQLAKYIADKPTLGLIQAMLIGDEVNLGNDTRQAFAETGIVHIIAISGGNVLVFFMAINLLLWWLKHKKYKWLKYAIALPLVWFYVLMAGAPPSAVRAAIMFSLLAFSIMLQKDNNSLNTLFATAFLLLCAEPMWLYAIGFQLSFLAVLSLIIFYRPVYSLYAPGNRVTRVLWQTVAASFAAELLVAPLVVYYFHTFPLMFLVANVVAYLFMGLVLYLGMGVLILSMVPALAQFLGLACTWLVSAFNAIVHALQGLNPVSFYYLQIDVAELLLIYLAIAAFAVGLLQKRKIPIYLGLAAVVCFVLLLCSDQYFALQQDKIVIYNTGKSLHAERIIGKRYIVLHTDTAAAQKIDYTTRPAHIGWHAWHEGHTNQQQAVVMNDKTVFFYHDTAFQKYTAPVDYLVVCDPVHGHPEQLYEQFHPKQVVIPQVQANLLQHWKVAAAKRSLKLHYLPEHGALILE